VDRLTHRERELVAIGASLASNCIPCVTYHVAMGKKSGLTATQIAEAIDLADKVRQMPARAVLDAAQRTSPEHGVAEACGCGDVMGSFSS